MPRAYSPRLSTVHLMAEIGEVAGVQKVRTLPPTTSTPYTRIMITMEVPGLTVSAVKVMRIAEAREWLASEEELNRRSSL